MPRLFRALATLGPILVLLAISIPPIFAGVERGRGYSDQVNYHERIIRAFSEQWPSPDLSDYPGVMTPLYHLLLAAAHRHVTADLAWLQLAASVFGPLLVLIVSLAVGRKARPALALAVVLPLACSMYVWDSTTYLLPDNMAWAMTAGILGLVMTSRPCSPPRVALRLGLIGVVLALLIATRQSGIWLAAAVWAWAFLGDDPDEQTLAGSLVTPRPRVARTLAAIAATLPAFAVLGWFFSHWGGRFQPPMWDQWYARAWNASAIPFVLALFSLYSAFFAGFWLPAAVAIVRRRPVLVAAAAAFTALAAAIPPSDYSIEMGRYGAIWSVADKFPIVGGRSFFMVGLSLLAGPILLAWAAALPYRPRWIFLAVLAAFSATQLKNPYLYQRYAEPLLLILLPMAASLIPHHGHRSLIPRDPALPAFGSPVANLAAGLATPLRYAGPIFLAIVLALMGLQTMRTAVRPVILPEGSIGNPPRATPKAPGPPPVSTGDVQPTLAR